MGNKAGYAQAILAALGLRSGQGAGAYVWAEADADVAALLRCYPDAAMLRRVAEIIRGWADEEPRALWERLRAERKARVPASLETQASRFIWTIGRSMNCYDGDTFMPEQSARGTPVWNAHPPGYFADACHRLAEYAVVVASNRLIHVADDGTGDLRNTGQGGTTFGGREFATAPGEVAARFEGMAWEVAAHSTLSAWTKCNDADGSLYMGPDRPSRCHPPGWTASITAAGIGRRYESVRVEGGGWPPVAVLPRIPSADVLAAMLGTPGDLDGVVVYMDPPYVGTTGYAHDLGRNEVIAFARDFDRLGAVVAISEAEVVIPEWRTVEITEGRRGQKRTFSRQQAEWLSMNREPAHRVATQAALFGGAA